MGRNIVSGPHVGAWVSERINGSFCPDHATAIGLEKNGSLIAGAIFEHWNGESIVAHFAADGRLTRRFIWALFNYAFEVCGAAKVILPVGSHNTKAIGFVGNLGFREEARIADAQPNGDIVLFTMSKGACKFLGDQWHG